MRERDEGVGGSRLAPDERVVSSRRAGSTIALVIPIIGIVVGLALLGAPVVTDWLETHSASRAISSASDIATGMDEEDRLEMLAQARGYNARLAGDAGYDAAASGFSPADPQAVPFDALWDYAEQLRADDGAMIAWIEIPEIAVREPVYHGIDDDSLSAGVGHVENTSLPVGGASSNCVLSAHSGVPTARMFDDLGKLEPGDTFTIWTLGEPYSYRVTGSETVLPEEVDRLRVQPGKDMATLVTCTPYGVNTHRLLVFGERCEYVPAEQPSLAAYVNGRTLPLLIGLSVVLAAAVIVLAARARRRTK